MNKPKRKKGEGEFSYAFRVACWLSDPSRLALRAIAEQKLNPNGTFTIQKPPRYK